MLHIVMVHVVKGRQYSVLTAYIRCLIVASMTEMESETDSIVISLGASITEMNSTGQYGFQI